MDWYSMLSMEHIAVPGVPVNWETEKRKKRKDTKRKKREENSEKSNEKKGKKTKTK